MRFNRTLGHRIESMPVGGLQLGFVVCARLSTLVVRFLSCGGHGRRHFIA